MAICVPNRLTRASKASQPCRFPGTIKSCKRLFFRGLRKTTWHSYGNAIGIYVCHLSERPCQSSVAHLLAHRHDTVFPLATFLLLPLRTAFSPGGEIQVPPPPPQPPSTPEEQCQAPLKVSSANSDDPRRSASTSTQLLSDIDA